MVSGKFAKLASKRDHAIDSWLMLIRDRIDNV